MKKTLLAGLAVGMLVSMTGVANANSISGTGHIYNTPDGGIIDDWYFTVGSAGLVTIDIDYVSGSGFDSEIYLLTDNLPGLTGESVVGNDDDSGGGLSSLLSVDLGSGNYHLRVSEWTFNDAFMTFEDSVTGNWYYNFTIQGQNVSFNDGAPVPEPATMILFGTGLAGFAAIRRKKKAC